MRSLATRLALLAEKKMRKGKKTRKEEGRLIV
jgi:hypothetical protein